MSSRNFRKLCGNSLPPPDDSDGDYDPISNHYNPRSTYDGLELSSDSDSVREHEPEDDTQEVTSSVSHGGARKKKPQKKKGKGKKSKIGGGSGYAGETSDGVSSSTDAISQGAGQRQLAGYSSRNTTEELDEIDKSIMEVNAILGTPPPASPQLNIPTNDEPTNFILEVHAKHLNVSNELRRLFGPDEAEEIRFRARSQPHRARILKRVMIPPTNYTLLYEFKKTGLSMSLERYEENIAYFVYDHDQDHQKMHQIYLKTYAQTFVNPDATLLGMGEYMKTMHVEPLLEIADALFRMDENSKANALIENIITYLQYVAHPSFNLSRGNVRLLYTYKENRPFHVAMLKYLYLLTNKACHRTALEIAKMLLNIDPSDPLAILFVIDTLALRAREHQWLIDAIEHFSIQRRANLLFNIQYSNALAHFHVALKNKRDLSEADKYLQFAILSYPQVVPMILECANVNEPRIQTHTLFINVPRVFANEDLNELIMIYARLTYSRWRESQVMEWFLKNAIEVAENYNNSDEVRVRATEQAMLRHNLYQAWPTEISRHVSVLEPMSNLILETPLRHARRTTGSSWDPLFDSGINRYGYRAPTDPPRNLSPGGRALLYRFFTSIIPNTELEPPVND